MVFRKSSFVGMGEAVLHEIRMHRLRHRVFADDAFEGEQHAGGLAIGDAAIRVGTGIVVGLLSHRVTIGHADIAEPLNFALASGRACHVQDGCVLAQNRIQNLDFGVAVDAFVHPGVLKFVGGHHAVPVLVSELVLHDDLHQVEAVRHKPA